MVSRFSESISTVALNDTLVIAAKANVMANRPGT